LSSISGSNSNAETSGAVFTFVSPLAVSSHIMSQYEAASSAAIATSQSSTAMVTTDASGPRPSRSMQAQQQLMAYQQSRAAGIALVGDDEDGSAMLPFLTDLIPLLMSELTDPYGAVRIVRIKFSIFALIV
jgi:hypothetical protein